MNGFAVDADYDNTTIMVTFQASGDVPGSTQRLCGSVPIIDDMVGNEPNEEFSVTLISASPDGRFGDKESCITIIDDDSESVLCACTCICYKNLHIIVIWIQTAIVY